MATRYVIVSLLPPQIDQTLRSWYQALTGQPVSIEFLHLTLVPAFFLNHTASLKHIRSVIASLPHYFITSLPEFSFSPPAYFTSPDEKLILHLPLTPANPLIHLSSQLIIQLSGHLTLDLSIYSNQKIPPYLPHISFDYDFPSELQEKALATPPPNHTFSLQPPAILKESFNHSWQIV